MLSSVKTGQILKSMSSPSSIPSNGDFFEDYMEYAGYGQSEAPAVFHRWTCISIIGALLGRQVWFPHGHNTIYPNNYILLMGTPASRKGAALNVGKNLIKAAGYTRFSSDRTSKERFLMDFKQFEENNAIADLEAFNFEEPAEQYVMAGEFVDFVGTNNIEFANLLTNLWDNLPVYKNPKIVGKSVEVNKPTVNLIGGATAQTFALALPPESNGTGFLSRILLIHGEPTGVRIAWPAENDDMAMEIMAARLSEMREQIKGKMGITSGARKLGAKMYMDEVPVEDGRFQHYKGRRFTHLLKIAMCIAAVELATEIEEIHLLKANTMLAAAEVKMPQALGGFGKDSNSDVKNKLLDFLSAQHQPRDIKALHKVVQHDVKKYSEFLDMIQNLKISDKIRVHTVMGKQGYVIHHEETKKWHRDLLVPEWLTEEERAVLL